MPIDVDPHRVELLSTCQGHTQKRHRLWSLHREILTHGPCQPQLIACLDDLAHPRLCSVVPHTWITARMKRGKHDDSLGLRTKKNRVREATRSDASNLVMHDGKALWIFQHQLNGLITETNCEPRPARRSSYHSAASSNSRRAARRKTTGKVISSGVQ
jgi:hypothetical protein